MSFFHLTISKPKHQNHILFAFGGWVRECVCVCVCVCWGVGGRGDVILLKFLFCIIIIYIDIHRSHKSLKTSFTATHCASTKTEIISYKIPLIYAIHDAWETKYD